MPCNKPDSKEIVRATIKASLTLEHASYPFPCFFSKILMGEQRCKDGEAEQRTQCPPRVCPEMSPSQNAFPASMLQALWGSEEGERLLIISQESWLYYCSLECFLSNLIKTRTYAIRAHKKVSPPNIFFCLSFFFFQPMKKLFWPYECLLLFMEQTTMLKNNLALLYFF